MTAVMYPAQLIEQIKAYWSAHDERYRLPPLPNDDDLRELLDVAFHAGLTREEDRPVRLCLAWCSPDEVKAAQRQNSTVIRLSNPVPLTVQNVRRLAVAVDHRSVVLAVARKATLDTEQAPELMIWGLIYIGESWARMVEGRQDSGGPGPPFCLLVTCPDAGSIFVTWRGLPVAKLHLGALESTGRSPPLPGDIRSRAVARSETGHSGPVRCRPGQGLDQGVAMAQGVDRQHGLADGRLRHARGRVHAERRAHRTLVQTQLFRANLQRQANARSTDVLLQQTEPGRQLYQTLQGQFHDSGNLALRPMRAGDTCSTPAAWTDYRG